MEENEMLRMRLKHSESVIERLSSQLETSGVKPSHNDSSRQNGIHFIDGEAPNGSRANVRSPQSPHENDLLDHSSADESDGQSSMRTENGARTASNKFAAKSWFLKLFQNWLFIYSIVNFFSYYMKPV